MLGHENPDVDSIISGLLLERLLNRMQIDATFIIPDRNIDEEQLQICKRYGIDPTIFQRPLEDLASNYYLLVDHHQRQLKGEIVGIIDHHPTLEDIDVSYYQNELASSTTCLLCQGREQYFTKDELGLAIMAAYVDTAAFHSTKARLSDLTWTKEVADSRQIDLTSFYQEGLCLTPTDSISSAALHGLKTYMFRNLSFASSYVQLQDVASQQEFLDKAISYLHDYMIEEQLSLFAFVVHDMDKFHTYLYKIFSDTVERKEYSQYTSRGSTIIPEIEKELVSLTKNHSYQEPIQKANNKSQANLYQKKKNN